MSRGDMCNRHVCHSLLSHLHVAFKNLTWTQNSSGSIMCKRSVTLKVSTKWLSKKEHQQTRDHTLYLNLILLCMQNEDNGIWRNTYALGNLSSSSLLMLPALATIDTKNDDKKGKENIKQFMIPLTFILSLFSNEPKVEFW